MNGRTLVAGIGNVFLGDDGFGVETLRALSAHPLPPGVEAVDFGVRGVHLAYQVLEGYDTLVLVDATARGGAPGTLYLIEVGEDTAAPPDGAAPSDGAAPPTGAALDGHDMSPSTVLALLDTLCAGTGAEAPRRVLVLGCEPACVEEGIGLSGPVADAVPRAVRALLELLAQEEPYASGTDDPNRRELRSTP
ncbi:hydrogenase maturation protease [Streptomyces sp. NBC_01298]|uniref:hydrogenase maturation protease n=1 Tax=Streptomyces sp. NBC_01298 TaxID=2903817 RepID=UPI002E114F5B|nr:hydrogenase maturation protease [Streptomyces sp. NBC_01298]